MDRREPFVWQVLEHRREIQQKRLPPLVKKPANPRATPDIQEGTTCDQDFRPVNLDNIDIESRLLGRPVFHVGSILFHCP